MSTSFVINTNVSAVLGWLTWWVRQGGGAPFITKCESVYPLGWETNLIWVHLIGKGEFGAAFEDETRLPGEAIRLVIRPATGGRVEVKLKVYSEDAVDCCVGLLGDMAAQWPEIVPQLWPELSLKPRAAEQATASDAFREEMTRLHEKGNVGAIVNEFARLWGEKMEKVWEGLENSLSPQDRTFWLWFITEMLRDDCRKCLKAWFGLVLDCEGPLRIHMEPNARAPSSAAEWCRFWEALSLFLLHETTRREILRAIEKAHETGEDEHEKAFEAVRTAWTEVPVKLTGAAMEVAPFAGQREVAALSFAGWADTEIRLFGRLAQALGAYGDDPRESKLKELAGSVLLAWSEREPDEPLTGPKSTVSRIASLLSSMGRGDLEHVSELGEQIPDEFDAREQARAEIADLREGAGLSAREDQVLNLRLMEYTLGEIADELEVAIGTVKSTLHRALNKLRTSAES